MSLLPVSRHVLASSLLVCTCIHSRSSRFSSGSSDSCSNSFIHCPHIPCSCGQALLSRSACTCIQALLSRSLAPAAAVVTGVTVVAVESSRLLACSLARSSVVASSRLAVSIPASSLCASNLFASSLPTPRLSAPTLLASSPLASSFLASSLLAFSLLASNLFASSPVASSGFQFLHRSFSALHARRHPPRIPPQPVPRWRGGIRTSGNRLRSSQMMKCGKLESCAREPSARGASWMRVTGI